MERAQREVLHVLLETILSRGMISKTTCLKAEDLAYSATDLPAFFQYPVCPAGEADEHECAADTE